MSGYALDPDEKIRPAAVQPGHDGEPYEPLAIRAPPSVEQMQIDTEANVELPRSKFQMFAILSALFLSLFLAALDQTIVSTAIPTIASHFHSASGYTWIGSAYLLANAAAAPIWAKVSDIWGRKPVLLAAVAIFFLSSLLCAISTSMGMLIAMRAIQGAAGGGLIILVNICISDLFSMRLRGLYFGLLEVVWAVACGVGPLLGGTFTELVSWRWIWYINLPFSGFTFFILLFYLDVHNPKTKMIEGLKAVDWLGSFAILGVTLMTLLGLDFGGQTFPWTSPKVICLIVFGLLMIVVFYFSEVKVAKYPLMPLQMLRQRTQVAALVVGFIHGTVFISGEYYLPLYFQSVREASPFDSGLLLLPLVLPEALTGIVVGVLIHRTGRYRELIWLGTSLLTLGYGLLIHLDAHSSLGEIIGLQIIAGIGGGLLFEPPMIAIQVHVSQDDTATATAAFGFVRNLATSLGIVLGGVVFQNSMQLREPRLRDAHLPANITQALSGAGAAANVMVIGTIASASQRDVVKEAFAWSLRNMWILFTSVGLCGVVASVFIETQTLGRHHVETVTGLKKEQTVETEAVVAAS